MKAADHACLFERLLVLDDPLPRPAALNMALDEALLLAEGQTPLLRIYRWERPAVSFGYFEPWAATAARFPGVELVRRWTGGGAVEHGEDFTYSLVLPRTHPLTNLPAGESYRLVHRALGRCVEETGAGRTELNVEPPSLPTAAMRECFQRPVRHDLLQNGSKLAGAAQRRTRQGLLHQGSLRPLREGLVDRTRLARTLPGFLGQEWTEVGLPARDLDRARQLAADKYSSDGWMRLR